MPNPETSGLNQKAVYWAPTTSCTSAGVTKVTSSNVELSVRWESDYADTPIARESGETISLDAAVKVSQDVSEEGIMWLGELTSLPDPPTNLYRIVVFAKIPNLKGTRYERWAGLQRYGNTLPPTV